MVMQIKLAVVVVRTCSHDACGCYNKKPYFYDKKAYVNQQKPTACQVICCINSPQLNYSYIVHLFFESHVHLFSSLALLACMAQFNYDCRHKHMPSGLSSKLH